jgi:hypothetical protein
LDKGKLKSCEEAFKNTFGEELYNKVHVSNNQKYKDVI